MSEIKPTECVLVCEECYKLLKWADISPDGKWGHICRARNYRREHRCESYVEMYEKRRVKEGK